eukprot:216636_1
MSAEKTVSRDCLSIKITTATFAQPRSYFLTAQCIHKDTNIDDTLNEKIPKYRTAASKPTKTPQFNAKKPFLLKLPHDIELSHVLQDYKVVFEAYTVVSTEENSNNKEAKLMGESILYLADKKQKVLNQETIEDVITLEGILKIEQTEKRVPVGQASITLKLVQIADTNPLNNDESKSLTSSLHTHIMDTPPLVKWPAVKHSNSIMIQINRWWGTNVDQWPESFIHIIHKVCGEAVTATHPKSESLNFYETLELPFDNAATSNHSYPPFIFKLVEESSRQIIESFALPSTCLCVLNQYDLAISFGSEDSKVNVDCCVWFNPNRDSMLSILAQETSMIIVQIGLNQMRGFDMNCRYSLYAQIINRSQSVSESTDTHSNKIKMDFNDSSSMNWQQMNHASMSSKRCWLHFKVEQCAELQRLNLFCFNDIISSNDHQIILKIYKDSPHSLLGLMTIPIQHESLGQISSTQVLDNNKEIDISIQLFTHQNAVDFMRFPTPMHDDKHASEHEEMSMDSRVELMEDTKTYKQMIKSELFESIKSQLPPFIIKEPETHKKKPTQRLFEAIERELTSKQIKIEQLELEREEKNEELDLIVNEMMRLREEMVSIKRLNERLSMRLREIVKNDATNMTHIDRLSKGELQSMLIKYGNGHKKEKNKRRQMEKAVSNLVEKLKSTKQIHDKLVKMQSTAQQQAEYIRKLQKRQSDIGEYRDTIVSQEEVIDKLEEMLSWAHGTIKTMQQKMESTNIESNRERELENEIIGLQQENEELRRQIQMTRNDKLHQMVDNTDVDKLKHDLKAANYRNDGLQAQLRAGAGQFGQQIAGLKIQIRQLKSDHETDINESGGEDLFSNFSDATAAELSQLSQVLDSVSIVTDNSL